MDDFFINNSTLKDRIRRLPSDRRIKLAARTFLRILGLYHYEGLPPLQVFRAIIKIVVAARNGEPSIPDNVTAPEFSIDFVNDPEIDEAEEFQFIVSAETAAQLHEPLERDVERLEKTDNPFDFPLFSSKSSMSNDQLERFFRPLQKAEYEYWKNWYRAFLDGKPLNWDVQEDIANLP